MLRKAETHLTWAAGQWPKIRRAGRFPHRDRRFEVTYTAHFHALHLYEYPATMRLGGREFAIQPGDATLTLPGVPSCYDLPRPGHHWCIHFDAGGGARFRGPHFRLPVHIPLGVRQGHAHRQLSEIIHLHNRAGRHRLDRHAAAAQLHALLLWLAAEARPDKQDAGGARADAAVRLAAELIEARLDRALSVPELAAEVGLSQNYLARHFRQQYGTTIPRYLLTRRIERARDLLVSTDLTIRRIGQRVGLPDPQHFNKQFRRLTGASPSALRRG